MLHPMEDYVFAQFKQVDDNKLGLFAVFDGHLSQEVPDYLRSHLFDNIINEVNHSHRFVYFSIYTVLVLGTAIKN